MLKFMHGHSWGALAFSGGLWTWRGQDMRNMPWQTYAGFLQIRLFLECMQTISKNSLQSFYKCAPRLLQASSCNQSWVKLCFYLTVQVHAYSRAPSKHWLEGDAVVLVKNGPSPTPLTHGEEYGGQRVTAFLCPITFQ